MGRKRKKHWRPNIKTHKPETVIAEPHTNGEQKRAKEQIAIPIVATTPTSNAQPPANCRARTNSDHCSANHASWVRRQVIELAPVITALVTVALVTTTFSQCRLSFLQNRALSDSNRFNRESIAAIQRAYLYVGPGLVRDFVVGKKTIVDVYIRNMGKTPARNVVPLVNVGLDAYPNEPNANTMEQAMDQGAHASPKSTEGYVTITPDIPFPSFSTLRNPLSDADMKQLKAGTEKLYAFGRLTYDDVFGCHYVAHYCYLFPSQGLAIEPTNLTDRAFQVCSTYNDEKTTCNDTP